MTDNTETTLISLDNLTKYTNRLKPKVITDVSLVNDNDDNILHFKYLNNTTKDITLPEAQGTLPEPTYRTITKTPLFFEIHFRIGEREEYFDNDADELAWRFNPSSSLELNFDDVKNMFKFSTGSSRDKIFENFNVTDVTESKKSDDYDKVFLYTVNAPVNPFNLGLSVDVKPSFGTVGITDSSVIAAINNQLGVSLSTVNAQVISGGVSIPFNNSDYQRGNYFVIDAIVNTFGIDSYDSEFDAVGNSNLKYDRLFNNAYCMFNLSVVEITNKFDQVEFRKVVE